MTVNMASILVIKMQHSVFPDRVLALQLIGINSFDILKHKC